MKFSVSEEVNLMKTNQDSSSIVELGLSMFGHTQGQYLLRSQ